MANIPIVKIGADFSKFSSFITKYKAFKKDASKPQEIGFKIDKNAIALLKNIATDLRVISQIQMGIISKSKRFQDVFKHIQGQHPIINGSAVATSDNKEDKKNISGISNLIRKLGSSIKSLSVTGVKSGTMLAARAIPQPVKEKWGDFSNRFSSAVKKIRSNPIVSKGSTAFLDAIKKLTFTMSKLTMFSMRAGASVLGGGLGTLLKGLKSIPIIGGLALGAVTGSLFGIGGAASRATELRSQSRNVGMTTGQTLAGKNVLSPYIDFQGWAQQITQEKTDIRKSNMFPMLGVGQNTSTSDILVAKMKKAAEIGRAYQGQSDLIGSDPFLKMMGIPAADALRLGSYKEKELNSKLADYQKQSKTLNRDDSTSKRLQDLNTNLANTSDLIKNKFATAIAAIAPQIEKLGNFFQGLLEKAFDPKIFKNIIDFTQNSIKKVTEWTKNFDGFGSIFKLLGTVFSDYLLTPLSKIFKDNLIDPMCRAFKDNLIEPLKNIFRDYLITPFGNLLRKLWPFGNDSNGGIQKTSYGGLGLDRLPLVQQADYTPLVQQPGWKTLPGSVANDNNPMSEYAKGRYLDAVNKRIGLPQGFMEAIRKVESNNNDLAKNPKSTAAGAFQMTKAAQKDYGVKNPYDFYDNAQGASRYIDHAHRMFGKDYRKDAVAYHMGIGGFQEHLKQYGAKWEAKLPEKEKEYLNKVERALGQVQRQQQQQQQQKVDININNNTGGSATVNTKMAGTRYF
ncbi:hypothetical protein CIN_21660 [Commensalibacter intestini A911]|uniref:Transglycosylase SLT domain-containing protein n=1 Tax=Commensalibacter intestini A911 TaxID=1088868 RepID=G6F3H0_9PROT|nr:transglycosylase SLT domain-containing protein [Commensalibacter intestini]EHD12920.1 hypothetical protein CIN_21660 [Commensalibacter intestini A911]